MTVRRSIRPRPWTSILATFDVLWVVAVCEISPFGEGWSGLPFPNLVCPTASNAFCTPALLADLGIAYRDDLFDALPALAAPSRAMPAPRKRDKIEQPSLPLVYGPTITDLLAELGPTHEAIAQQVGLSRPQVTNVLVGRFGVSRPVARRVLELSSATGRQAA